MWSVDSDFVRLCEDRVGCLTEVLGFNDFISVSPPLVVIGSGFDNTFVNVIRLPVVIVPGLTSTGKRGVEDMAFDLLTTTVNRFDSRDCWCCPYNWQRCYSQLTNPFSQLPT